MLFGTLFYKRISDIIQTDLFDYEATVPGSGTQVFNVSGPVNFGSGYIRGAEIGGRTFFDFLPGALAGFGAEANFTYVDSRVPSPFARDENNQPIQTTKQGLSRYSYNLVGFFERWGLTARVAYNWRSDFLLTATGNGTGFLPIYRRPYGQVDASLSYDISRNVAVSAFVVNLTREATSDYQVEEDRFRLNQLDDRRFGLTIRVRN
jgi:TonB-dependent receptor